MGSPQHDGWMRRFLHEEAEAQTAMLRALRGRIERGMAAADPASTDPPSREWVRAARLYFDGYKALATQELEVAKVRLLAQRVNGKQPMTDAEYEAQLQALGRDAIGTMSVEELEAELARKRALPVPADG